MPRYKRTADDAELDIHLEPEVPAEQMHILTKLRSMWEFACLMQYIFLFGHVVKIDDDFDIEDLEAECLRPDSSEKLAQIGLQLLKYVSSHRGLTPEIFDEYTRRQYVAKAPHRNPYGEDEEPAKFNEFAIFTKIQVLQQLSTWTLGNADRIRSMMPEDEDPLNWRMEPLGWDKEDRAYFVLDDNRLYRRTDEPPPLPTPKAKAKSKTPKKAKSRGTRTSKRRKVEESSEDEVEEADVAAGAQEDTVMTNGDHVETEEPDYGFTNKTWECIAITLEEYNDFLASIFRSRDPNEKQLRKRIEEDVLPIIEKRAEALRQKQLKKIRELENLQKMATAKRSSRIADKAEKEQKEREEREAEEKRQRDLKMAHEEHERQRRIEEGHESRRLTREQRVKEREVKRILHEEELARIEEQANRASSQDPSSDSAAEASKRMSERQLKTAKAKHKEELEKLAEEEGAWYFDCSVCGLHGENLDDGSHSIACDRCNVWQHSKCHSFSPKQAEKEGFTFICGTCKRKEADAKKPKIAPLKLSNKNRQSASPEAQRSASRPTTANGQHTSRLPDHVARQLDGNRYFPPPAQQVTSPFGPITYGPNPSPSPYGQNQGAPAYRYPPVGNFAPHPHQQVPPPQQPWQGSPLPPPGRPPSSGYAGPPPPPIANGYGSPPHHQQQHQYAHQNAIAASGGHPAYQPAYQPQSNGYSPCAPSSMYPVAQPQPPHPQYYPPPPYYSPQTPYQQPSHQRTGSGSSQLMNGFQSPAKTSAKLAGSPQQQPPQSYRQNPPPFPPPLPPQHQHRLSQSPNPKFPAPRPSYPPHGAHSPVKYSPPPHQYQQPLQPQRPSQPPPNLAQTPQPQSFHPPSTNGVPPRHQTPHHQQSHPSPASANANGIVADGMSGPWPEGSKAIPQKHDQSPAPPTTSHSVGEKRVVQPVAPTLVPSPSQQMHGVTGPQSVPVKKMLEVNGAPLAPPQQMENAMAGVGEKPADVNGTPVQSAPVLVAQPAAQAQAQPPPTST